MSARARVHANATTVVRPAPLAVAKVALTRAETELAARVTELTAAREAEIAALRTFDDSGADADLDAATRETKKRERAERVEERARDAVAEVRSEVARLERAAGLEALAAEKTEIEDWQLKLSPIADRGARLYRELHTLAIEAADVVLDAIEARDRIEARASSLGLHVADIPRPSLADARLTVRRAILAARRADDLDELTEWVETESISNWRFDRMNASEVAQFQAAAKRAEAQPAQLIFTTIAPENEEKL